jgi:hypothetical protein
MPLVATGDERSLLRLVNMPSTYRLVHRFAHSATLSRRNDLRRNAGMAESTTSEEWAMRQQAQAAGFDAIVRRI